MYQENWETSRYRDLVDRAVKALEFAYTPYSHFQVGAALLDRQGRVWTGCNIESASYTPTSCAERTALFKAVSEGVKEFQALVVVGRQEGKDRLTEKPTAPCGVCRQALVEFCPPDMPVILADATKTLSIFRLDELLPLSFTKEQMEE